MAEPRPMPEAFSEISRKSIWALVKEIAAIAEVLKKELPYDSLMQCCHNEEGTDDFMIGIFALMGEIQHSLTIYTHSFDSPPEPKEVYPSKCCAIGTLEIASSEPQPRESFEVCGTPERWMVHQNDKWTSLSASYVAFLLGKNQKPPDAT